MRSNRFPETVYPGAQCGDDFSRFGLCEFGAPGRNGRDLVDPDGERGGVVFCGERPGVGEAGGGVGDEVGRGACEVCGRG